MSDGAAGTVAEFVVRLYPYVAAARLRRARTLPHDPFAERPPSSPGAALNRIGRQRRTSTPDYRPGVGVSTDTLYTSAWADLADGPLVLETPRFDGRYYSFQIGSADTSSDAAFGLRTHGDDLPPLFLHGPGYAGEVPGDMVVAASRTRYLNLPGRMLVDPDDPADMEAAHRLQDGIRLRTWKQFLAGIDEPAPVPAQSRVPEATAGAPGFLAQARAVIAEDGLNPEDAGWVASLPSQAGLTDEAIAEGYAVAMDRIDRRAFDLGVQHGGWTVNLNGPRFGDDLLLRAAVTRDQIYVTVPEEGLYPLGKTDDEQRPLHGDYDYRIVFAAGQEPPVDAFWSITLYDAEGFLVPNEHDAYAVNGRTAARRDDGAIEIAVGRDPGRSDINRLPAPKDDFYLMMRMFLPREPVRSGAWLPPAIRRVS